MVAWLDGRSHFPPRLRTRLSWPHLREGRLIMQWGALKLVLLRSDGKRGASDLKWSDWLTMCWSVCWLCFASASFTRLVYEVVFFCFFFLSDAVWETTETQLWTLQLVPFFSSAPLTFPMGSSWWMPEGSRVGAKRRPPRTNPRPRTEETLQSRSNFLKCRPLSNCFLFDIPLSAFDLACLVRRRSCLWADFSSGWSRKLRSIKVVKCRDRFCGCLEFYDVAMMLFEPKTSKR